MGSGAKKEKAAIVVLFFHFVFFRLCTPIKTMPPRRAPPSAPPPAPPPPAPGADLEATARAAALAQAFIGAGWLDDGRAAALYRTVVGAPPSSEWGRKEWLCSA